MHLTADGGVGQHKKNVKKTKSAHNLSWLLRFFIGVRLALSCDLLF
jgi:hypothetical protein